MSTIQRERTPEPSRFGPAVTSAEEISLLQLCVAVLRGRRLVLALGLAAMAVTAAIVLARPRTYTAASIVMPQNRRQGTNLSGLAAQLGLTLPNIEGNQSGAFYADLLKSRPLLERIVDTTFTVGGAPMRVADALRAHGRTPALRRDDAVRRLADALTATVSSKTSVIQLEVTLPSAELAAAVNRRLLELLNEFNLTSRQSQASAERQFTERRLGEVRRDLREAEDRLQGFLQQNRDYRNSPQLLFQFNRLEQDVMMQRQVYSTLAQAFEQAKIEEVRDTPVITIVESPEVPVRPDPRRLALYAVLALVAGMAVGAALSIVRDAVVRSGREAGGDYAELVELRRRAWWELRHPVRAIRQARTELRTR
jgi:uncharacterized protein involved in exopolysaccharide biosynthesis